jgi:phosphoglycolate phosphatase
MIIHTKPSAIIFDFDDTLVDAKPIINGALEATFIEFNINKAELKHIDFNLSLRDYFHHIFGVNVKAARESYYKHYTEFSKELKPLANAELVLQFLQNNGVFIAIVSNKGGERLRNEITNKFTWHHYFTSIIGSGDAIEDKPSMHPAKLALHGSGIMDYSNVWLIGDSSVDLKTAQNLGCKAILFGNNTQADNIPFYLSVANHQELLKLLENIYV